MTTTRPTSDRTDPEGESQAERSIGGAIEALTSVQRDLTRFHPELITPLRFIKIRRMMLRLLRNHRRVLNLLAHQIQYSQELEQRLEKMGPTCHD